MKQLLVFFLCFAHFMNAQNSTNLNHLSYDELDSLMYLEYDNGDFYACIQIMKIGQEKAKKEFGDQDTIYALYTSDIASFYTETGQYKLAEPLFVEAMAIYANTMGKDHPYYASNLNNLSQLYEYMGLYLQAEPLVLETIALRAKELGKTHPDYARSLNNLAILYVQMGNFADAEPLYIEAKQIWANSLGKEHPDYSTSLNNLANLYHQLNNYKQAEQLLLECVAIDEKTLGKQHPQYASSLCNLAMTYIDLGDYNQAEQLFLEAKNIREKTLHKTHPLYANSLNSLSSLYHQTYRYKLAEKFLLEGLDIQAKTLGTRHISYALGLNNLANLYIDMGVYSLAWSYLQQAIASFSGLNLNTTINHSWSDSLLQVQYPSNNHLENISITLQHVYRLIEKENHSSKKEQQLIVTNLANQLLKKSKNNFVNEQDKLRMLSHSYHWMLRSLKTLDFQKQVNDVFSLIEENKANLLLEATKSEQTHQLGNLPDSLVQKEANLLKKYAQLEAKLVENRAESDKDNLRSTLNEIGQEIQQFQHHINTQYPQYASLKNQQIAIKTEDIQQHLKPNAALLEYVLGDSVIYIIYIDKKNVKIVANEVSSLELAKRINMLHEALSNYNLVTKKKEAAYLMYTEQAYWFYQNLIAPVLQKKSTSSKKDKSATINQLIIVTDGELGHLPFEVFLSKQAPQGLSDYSTLPYLLHDYKISYNYSATLWKENRAKNDPIRNGEVDNTTNNGLLFAMASDYNLVLEPNKKHLRLPYYQRLRKELNPLSAAQEEIKLLEKKYNGFFAFDDLASEKIFKEKAGDYAIIHLAMHGLLNESAPILSSLAFSEDSDSLENNFLQAHEISKLKLNANLVVLSACETGYGKFEKGNGIASLARAFMYAGASSLIVSLWQVNDFSTSKLMQSLYQNLADGMDKDAALQQAKLQYITQAKGITAHPAFWSPFILIGDESPVTLSQKGSYYWWLTGFGILALVASVWMLRRKNK